MEIVQSNEEADRYIYKNVDDDGIASFRLNDGEYRLAGYYDNSERKSYFFNESITVMDGTTSPNPYIIDVTNSGLTSIKGSLSDSKGFVGSSKITFSNRTIGEIFITDVNFDGSFSQDVPDGEYSIESIYRSLTSVKESMKNIRTLVLFR